MTFAAGLATEGYQAVRGDLFDLPAARLRPGRPRRRDPAVCRCVSRIDRAGLVGADGPTHAGAFDVAYLGCLPGFVIMAAADEAELVHMVATAVAIDDRPSRLRYPRGEGVGVEMPDEGMPLEIGKGRILREGYERGAAVVRHAAAGMPARRPRAGGAWPVHDGRRCALRQAARCRSACCGSRASTRC